MDWSLALVIVALVLAAIAQLQARGQSLLAWSVIILCWLALPVWP